MNESRKRKFEEIEKEQLEEEKEDRVLRGEISRWKKSKYERRMSTLDWIQEFIPIYDLVLLVSCYLFESKIDEYLQTTFEYLLPFGNHKHLGESLSSLNEELIVDLTRLLKLDHPDHKCVPVSYVKELIHIDCLIYPQLIIVDHLYQKQIWEKIVESDHLNATSCLMLKNHIPEWNNTKFSKWWINNSVQTLIIYDPNCWTNYKNLLLLLQTKKNTVKHVIIDARYGDINIIGKQIIGCPNLQTLKLIYKCFSVCQPHKEWTMFENLTNLKSFVFHVKERDRYESIGIGIAMMKLFQNPKCQIKSLDLKLLFFDYDEKVKDNFIKSIFDIQTLSSLVIQTNNDSLQNLFNLAIMHPKLTFLNISGSLQTESFTIPLDISRNFILVQDSESDIKARHDEDL
jgi:hypothetical protein